EEGGEAQGNGPEYGSVHWRPAGHGGVGRGPWGPTTSKAGPPGERAGRAIRGGECSLESVRVFRPEVKGRTGGIVVRIRPIPMLDGRSGFGDGQSAGAGPVGRRGRPEKTPRHGHHRHGAPGHVEKLDAVADLLAGYGMALDQRPDVAGAQP